MTNSSSTRKALVLQKSFSPFSSKLIQTGFVDGSQMQQALVESRKSGRALTDVLESIAGQQLSPELVRQYKKQQLFELKILYGVESLDPEIEEISESQVTDLIDGLIPVDICRRHRLVPLSQSEEKGKQSVLIAMVDPENLEAQDDLNRILRPKNISLQRMVITIEDYQRLMAKFLDELVAKEKEEKLLAGKPQKKIITPAEVSTNLEDLDLDSDSLEDDVDDDDDLGEALLDAGAAPVIALVNKILVKALQEEVSDIHVEPQEEYLRIRFRKDGVLREAFPHLPKKIVPAATARFKIIAELDIAERRLPQDGRIRRVFQGRKVDFRVSTLPSRYGEKVVLRILDNSSTQLGLGALITDEETLNIVQDMAKRPFGLILVTGPTGSGKTTSLYSVLSERNEPGVNISTAEDPIEYALPGITQVQVIREKGMNFAAILRSFLRQDPDVILVGETRDPETAKTAIEAALTGHLVLTTLHTNDAAGAVARLGEMGVESFQVANSLIGVLAQRLVRRVCSDCRVAYQPTPEELARYGLSASKDHEMTLYKANRIPTDEISALKEAGQLCGKCGGSGYKGRVGVYEVMRVTERLQQYISEGAPSEQIKEIAVEEGMHTLLAYSLNLVKEGHTTLEEVERVTFTDKGLEAELKAKRKSVLSCSHCTAELHHEWLDCPYCLTPRYKD
ncbi:GspE/PulE family protein [cf. Phormidesmis sp. LEGE 11477]|uniref:GspE/PulE family protein n=1 Tax=cf. Phormidesmis sp. LEGE 11477 TaxID=1828680 RepID=UPI00187F3A40|nr:GspE/PulE family protein [cf. Phormidesmis sp. LEGE 11477]MBE9062675.1 type II/IV secretion system protein [cf. Phormidesmis sp. LEGE 11477]